MRRKRVIQLRIKSRNLKISEQKVIDKVKKSICDPLLHLRVLTPRNLIWLFRQDSFHLIKFHRSILLSDRSLAFVGPGDPVAKAQGRTAGGKGGAGRDHVVHEVVIEGVFVNHIFIMIVFVWQRQETLSGFQSCLLDSIVMHKWCVHIDWNPI